MFADKRILSLGCFLLSGCAAAAGPTAAYNAPQDGGVGDAAITCASLLQEPNILGSNNNYLLSNNCTPLQGVSVTVSVTQDMVATNGFALQLNADGMLNSTIVWQQYVMAINSQGQLFVTVDNWNGSQSQIFNQWVYLYTMPQQTNGDFYVPTGYEFNISLSSDSEANITGATFTLTGNTGQVLSNLLLQLGEFNQYDGGAYNTGDIGPIGDFTLDVVGFDNGNNTVFLSGTGNITYHAAGTLTAAIGAATCVHSYFTAESSNSEYGSLPLSLADGDYVQTFTNCGY